ncbi:MAG: rhomboid family intramembrane serine protease [Ornithinimicrobium sp.]
MTSDAPPVCPRHPDQVAYVRCQRCGRPTCPQCQRPAAVGIQCVDCVAQAAKEAPRVTSRFGAPVRSGSERPQATYTLIAISVVVYVGQRVSPALTSDLLFSPHLAVAQPWRALTTAFLHSPGSITHIAFNMFALYIIGGYLEPMLGRLRFVLLYLVSALGGSAGVVVLATVPQGWFTSVVGASGAVFGLFAAVLVLNWRMGREIGGIIALLLINVVLGFVLPSIAWQAHFGGALTGAALAGILAYTAAPGRDAAALAKRRLQWPGFAVVTVVVIAAAAWRIWLVQGF